MGRKKSNIKIEENKNRILSRDEIAKLPADERIKFEVADELGLYDKVLEGGWRSLTSQEAGRIGGMIARRKKKLAAEKTTQAQDGSDAVLSAAEAAPERRQESCSADMIH